MATVAPTRATDQVSRVVLGAVRIVVGLLWLTNTGWKVPPDFGRAGNRGLHRYLQAAVDHPVFQPYSWFVEHVVLPHLTLFGWWVLLLEVVLGAFLTFGLATRFWALVGTGHAVLIALSVLRLGGEWPWSYYLMVAANLVVFATAGGRCFGIDGVIRPSLAQHRRGLGRFLWWAS